MTRRKLMRRMLGQKGGLSPVDREDVERRATSALHGPQLALRFDHAIPNHDGDDSETWPAFHCPVGDAPRALLVFAVLPKRKRASVALPPDLPQDGGVDGRRRGLAVGLPAAVLRGMLDDGFAGERLAGLLKDLRPGVQAWPGSQT